jgi:PAS domain-containing protein
VSEKRGYSTAYRIVLPDGTIKHLETIVRPAFATGGELVEIVTTQIDVTERKRTEEALRESEAKFRDYAEAASDWFWEIGPDYKFTITMLTENAFGSHAADRIGTMCWDHALDLETEPEKWCLIWETLDSRKPFRDFVYCTVGGNGSLMYVRASGKPVFDANGEFGGYRGTGADVTALRTIEAEARENEQRYRKAQLELAHANRVATMGQLTSSIAHEVNQPITATVTYALAARRWLSADPPNFREVDEALSHCQGGESRRRCRRANPCAHQEVARTNGRRGDQRCHSRGYCSHPYGGGKQPRISADAVIGEVAMCAGRSRAAATGTT